MEQRNDIEPEARKSGLVQKGTEELAARVRARSCGEGACELGAVDERGLGDCASDSEWLTVGLGERTPVPDDAPMLLLISGSPRRRTCVSLIEIIERGAREAGVRTQRFLLCEKHIDPCNGCGACNETGTCVLANRTTVDGRFYDDYLELTGLLDRCDGLALVAPVYFSGPTAQLKALFDRFQPYWSRKYVLGRPFPSRRPAQLFVVGAGGDPHGFEPFVTISRSCLQIAGFELEKVGNFVGCKAPRDVPPRPTAEQAEQMNAKELALANAAVDQQEEFWMRALESGRMLGRMLNNAANAQCAQGEQDGQAEPAASGGQAEDCGGQDGEASGDGKGPADDATGNA